METRLGASSPDALHFWWQPLICQPRQHECWGSRLLLAEVDRKVWPCVRVLVSLALVPENMSSTGTLAGEMNCPRHPMLSTLSEQQTQLDTSGACLLTSAGVSGFYMTDLGLQAPNRWADLFPRHCLSPSVNIGKGGGMDNRNLAGQISLWREENQRPCQHRFDWFLTSWTRQLSFRELNPLGLEMQAVGASWGRSWAWKHRWAFKAHPEPWGRASFVLLHSVKRGSCRWAILLGSPCALGLPRMLLHRSREMVEFPRTASNTQHGARWLPISPNNVNFLTKWVISVGTNKGMAEIF